MKVADFDYHLPPELIAQEPLEQRDSSKLMVIDRQKQKIKHCLFSGIAEYLCPRDCLVLNDARVLPARLLGKKNGTGSKVELLLLSEVSPGKWEVLGKPGKKLQPGTVIDFGQGSLRAVIEKRMAEGKRLVSFEHEGIFQEVLPKIGKVPLPPYIHKNLADTNRYQTVYAKKGAAVAAPTAGLHFTGELLQKIADMDVKCVSVTLDVGLDSFRPVRTQEVEEHKMHSEKFSISRESVDTINTVIGKGRRIIAVGTTSARVLESVAVKQRENWIVEAGQGKTDLFIYPGYGFKIVDALLTNFHLPQSTLLMLVCAFTSRELIMKAYQEAVKHRYRFFSFGDAMLIL